MNQNFFQLIHKKIIEKSLYSKINYCYRIGGSICCVTLNRRRLLWSKPFFFIFVPGCCRIATYGSRSERISRSRSSKIPAKETHQIPRPGTGLAKRGNSNVIYRTSPAFKWLKCVQSFYGLVFKWYLNIPH